MNTLKFIPPALRKAFIANMKMAGIKSMPERYHKKTVFISLVIGLISSPILYFFDYSPFLAFAVFAFMYAFFYFSMSLKANDRIRKMEKVFPDVISLMSSNLRSGITVDRAFLLSARPEFAPLDDEILKAGKEVATGSDTKSALENMSARIGSEKIDKTVTLINSGLQAGGNIADLLEQTAANMKEKEFIEKRAASNILMYVIFIFFAVGVGAPLLFALSTVLVDIVINLAERTPDLGSVNTAIPISLTEVSISPEFVLYFSLLFIVVSDLVACLVIGLVNKGDAKSGLKFFLPIVVFSLVMFFLIRIVVSNFLGGMFASV